MTPGSINLSQGFPDFDPPQEILDALKEAAEHGPHQYSITFGAKNFRDALAEMYTTKFAREIDPEKEIVVTCGGTEAMMAAMMTVCNPGDKVAVFSPFYENYGADAILSGADPVYVPLVPPDFHYDSEALERAFQAGAKALSPDASRIVAVVQNSLVNLVLNPMPQITTQEAAEKISTAVP